jgi:hypothetical protein
VRVFLTYDPRTSIPPAANVIAIMVDPDWDVTGEAPLDSDVVGGKDIVGIALSEVVDVVRSCEEELKALVVVAFLVPGAMLVL